MGACREPGIRRRLAGPATEQTIQICRAAAGIRGTHMTDTTNAPVPETGGGAASSNSQTAARGRTLGPVSDLERHLPSDWWNGLFNSLYLKTDGDVVENAENTRREVDLLISAAGLEPGDRILDLCCGQGRHCLELASRGYRHVNGVDRSRYLIRLARRRARRDNLAVAFHEGDARKFRLPDSSVDCVAIMGNSFGYFDQAHEDGAVLERVKRVLRSRGTLVMDLADGDWLAQNYEKRSWEWIDQSQLVCRERSLSAENSRLISREVIIDAEKGVIADQFYAERLYSRAAAAAMLEAAGFSEIRFHEGLETQSLRDQDLGMMAHRMFLTAAAPSKASRSGRSRVPYPNVTVLMGDPRLPDSVKLGGQFNQEDMVTIERLKGALEELGQYNFTYLDNHSGLLATLRQNPPDFVLNLCDEGFNNDAFKELHVPSYLELVDVPYSGAGPTCLGLCYDKSLVRAIAQSLDVAVPLETFVDTDDMAANLPSVLPALIKPAQGDSSIGITKDAVVHDPAEVVAYLAFLRESLPGRPVLIQEYLTGAEYSVGVIGNPGLGYTVLPLLEVDYSKLPAGLNPILSYESKWEPGSPYWTDISYRQAEAEPALQQQMIDASTRLFERLGCRDYARFDFRCDEQGVPKLLEVNPNPGWCWDGKLNLMAGLQGLTYADLLRIILEAAQTRSLQQRGVTPAAATPEA